MYLKSRIIPIAALCLAAGCDASEIPAAALNSAVGDSYPPCTQNFVPQGRSMQGRSMQGTETDGWSVAAVRFGCTYVDNVSLQGTVLTGSVNGSPLALQDFVGAQVIEVGRDGTYAASTIGAIEDDPKDSTGVTKLYTLTYTDETGATQNTCLNDADGVAKAIPVSGSWDETGAHIASNTTISFSCTKGVIAKCVRWGYRPWQSKNGKSLADYHQACTRMARADYCGDGVTHTEDGTLIDMYDDLGVQVKSGILVQPPLVFDAAWTVNGAYCMTKERWLSVSNLVSVSVQCKNKFINLFPLLDSSPVDPLDLCALKRGDVARSDVHLDNKSGVNIELF